MDMNPPRMPRRHKPLRAFRLEIRKMGILNITIPDWLNSVSYQFIVAALLSLIPGLGHLLQKRFSQIWWAVLLWALLLTSGIFFLGSQIGVTLISASITTHAYIIVHSMLANNTFWRVLTKNAIIAVLLFYLYIMLIWRTLLGFAGGFGAADIPSMQLHINDYFLTRRVNTQTEIIQRGDFYSAPAGVITNLGRRTYGSIAVFQIVGLPNETVEIIDGAFVINGTSLDKNIYPPQSCTIDKYINTTLGKDEYFVNIEYRRNRVASGDLIARASTFRSSDLRGKAIAKWQPWQERLFFRD